MPAMPSRSMPSTTGWRRTIAITIVNTIAAAMILYAGTSRAGSMAVTPVNLRLGAPPFNSRVDVENRGAQTITVQVDARLWRQTVEGEDLTPTDALLFNPPLFSLAPGQRQIVRLGLREPVAARAEGAFRLYFMEVSKPDADSDGLRLSMRLGVPVFVEPEDRQARADLHWEADRAGGRSVALTLTNRGLRHARMSAIQLLDTSTGRELGRLPAIYSLPQSTRRWRFEGVDLAGSPRLTVRADIDGQIRSVEISPRSD